MNLAAPSGPGTHMREVIRGFRNRGHEVVVHIAGGTELNSSSPAINYKQRNWKRYVPSIVWHTLKDLDLLRRDRSLKEQLVEVLRKEKPDLVYERGYYMMTSGVEACAEAGVRHFIEINAPYPEEKKVMEGRSLLSSKAVQAEKAQVRGSEKVFVVSTALREYLSARIPGSLDRIRVTPNAYNPEYLQNRLGERNVIKARLGMNERNAVIGFVGSIFPYHGVDVLIRAFSQISAQFPASRLVIVGDGETLPSLREMARLLGLEQRIHFTGNVPHGEVYDLIDVMDIAVMARSNWYGSPVKIFEYGALNKAIIAPDTTPVRDVMESGKDGIIISDSVEALSDALLFMLNNPDIARGMAMHFGQKVRDKHTWQHVADLILSEV